MEPTQSTEKTSEAKASEQKLSIQTSIIIGALIIAGSILLAGHFGAGSPQAANPGDSATAPTAAVNVKDVSMIGEPFIGDPSAPAMVYYTDYQCPFCKKLETTVIPTIVKDYVATGKVKIVFKDFTFLGPDSVTAALFGRAVWNLYPEQYFAWREAMYNAQDQEGNVGFGNRATIEVLTKTIAGIDQAKVSAAVDANTAAYQKMIDADYAEGSKFGIKGTPSVIIGKTLIDGAYPLASYTDALNKMVK